MVPPLNNRLQNRMANILWQGIMFFLVWNIEIFYSKLEYVISLFLKNVIKNSDGIILSEGWTLFGEKGLNVFFDMRFMIFILIKLKTSILKVLQNVNKLLELLENLPHVGRK